MTNASEYDGAVRISARAEALFFEPHIGSPAAMSAGGSLAGRVTLPSSYPEADHRIRLPSLKRRRHFVPPRKGSYV